MFCRIFQMTKKLFSIRTNEWPAQGVTVTGDEKSVDSASTLASIFDQVQLLKSKTCIGFHVIQEIFLVNLSTQEGH